MSDQWLSLDDLETALPAIAAAGVSRVARGVDASSVTDGGFVQAYRYAGGSPAMMRRLPATSGQSWADRRASFISRHVAQAEAQGEPWIVGGLPTRRLLALLAWAYVPPAVRRQVIAWLDQGAPSEAASRPNGRRKAPAGHKGEKARADLAAKARPPVAPELADAFVALVRDSAKKRQIIEEHLSAAVPALAEEGFLQIDGVLTQLSFLGADWPVYTVRTTKRGRSALGVMARARAALSQLDAADEQQRLDAEASADQVRLFRGNPIDVGDAVRMGAQTVALALDPQHVRADEVRSIAQRGAVQGPAHSVGGLLYLTRPEGAEAFDPATLRAVELRPGVTAIVGLRR